MSKDNTITVEVAYALPHRQVLVEVELPVGATALEAAQRSAIASKFGLTPSDRARLQVSEPKAIGLSGFSRDRRRNETLWRISIISFCSTRCTSTDIRRTTRPAGST